MGRGGGSPSWAGRWRRWPRRSRRLLLASPAMGRGARSTVRWKHDRIRRKKARRCARPRPQGRSAQAGRRIGARGPSSARALLRPRVALSRHGFAPHPGAPNPIRVAKPYAYAGNGTHRGNQPRGCGALATESGRLPPAPFPITMIIRTTGRAGQERAGAGPQPPAPHRPLSTTGPVRWTALLLRRVRHTSGASTRRRRTSGQRSSSGRHQGPRQHGRRRTRKFPPPPI